MPDAFFCEDFRTWAYLTLWRSLLGGFFFICAYLKIWTVMTIDSSNEATNIGVPVGSQPQLRKTGRMKDTAAGTGASSHTGYESVRSRHDNVRIDVDVGVRATPFSSSTGAGTSTYTISSLRRRCMRACTRTCPRTCHRRRRCLCITAAVVTAVLAAVLVFVHWQIASLRVFVHYAGNGNVHMYMYICTCTRIRIRFEPLTGIICSPNACKNRITINIVRSKGV